MGSVAAPFKADGLVGSKLYPWAAKPKIPKPDAPPPAPDTSAPILKELARQATERSLQKSKGRSAAVGMLGSVEPYRAPGSRGTTG